MNRRDTVIIAAILNCVLLGALFVTSKRPEEKRLEIPASAFCAPIVDSSITSEGRASESPTKELARQFVEEPIVITKATGNVATPSSGASATEDYQGVPESLNTPSKKVGGVAGANKDSACVLPTKTTAPATVATPVEMENESGKDLVDNSADEQRLITIVVKKGDFLEKIAKANGTTVHTIMKLNKLTSTQLRIGQVLKVPGSAEDKKVSSVVVASSEDYYTVAEGDSAWSVALRHKMKVSDLLKLNELDEHSARKLRPGDRLRIR